MSCINTIHQIILSSSPPITLAPSHTPIQSFTLSSSPLASPTAILKKFGGKPRDQAKVPVPNDDIWEIHDSCPEQDEIVLPTVKQRKVVEKKAVSKKSEPSVRKSAKPKSTTNSKAKSSTVLKEKGVNVDLLDGNKSEYFPAKRKRTAINNAELPTNKVATEIIRESPPRAHTPLQHIPQRRQWTPVKDTVKSPKEEDKDEHCAKSFSQRIEGLKFSREISVTSERATSAGVEGEGIQRLPTRKRTIEMLSIPRVPKVTKKSGAKEKSKKKTATSITGLATAQYRTGEKENTPTEPITRYFSIKKSSGVKRKPTATKAGKASKRSKPEEETVVLLSPNSARKAFQEQEFEFGTCSQLEQDVDGSDHIERPVDEAPPMYLPSGLLGKSGFVHKRRGCGLWDAAARDTDEGLGAMNGYNSTQLPAQVLGSRDEARTSTPEPTETVQLTACKSSINSKNVPTKSLENQNTVTIDLTDSPVPTKKTETSVNRPKETPTIPSTTIAPESSVVSEISMVGQTQSDVPLLEMPDFSGYPTTRLQAELNSFGFKKIGSRSAMVSTMEMCWKAQNKLKTPTTVPQALRSRSASAELTKKKRSESAKSSRISKSHHRPLLDTDTDGNSPCLSTQSIHRKISQAIREAANPNDASSGFFYRQILMYDPIVLEDLAAWLNTIGLANVGVDEEVHVAEVRAWCDINSICCLAKETQKGLERKRF
ncbi:Slx4 endonuclease-domain-containing protein [Geopyxis carbonaria]|nr:Slx4 endonuclease-domain-containing protein [Geopyxis carbonaria]